MKDMTEETVSQWLDVVSGVVGISIAEHQRAGVIQNLLAAASMAELTDSLILEDLDPAPVFVPIEP